MAILNITPEEAKIIISQSIEIKDLKTEVRITNESSAILKAIENKDKLDAIKRIRSLFDIGIKDAKDICDILCRH